MKEIIGIIGTIASGKDTTSDYISSKLNLKTYSMSAYVKEIAVARGLEVKREVIANLSKDIVKTFRERLSSQRYLRIIRRK